MRGEVSPPPSLWPAAHQHDHREPLPYRCRPAARQPAPIHKITDLRRHAYSNSSNDTICCTSNPPNSPIIL
jgi:hypothetical protein